MVFAGGKKGIRLRGLTPEIVELGNGLTADDCLKHDETDATLGTLLARMDYPEFPVPMGVLHRSSRPTYDGQFQEQIATASAAIGTPDVRKLLTAGDTWVVE
jgi:2-oxoglutarate ferredoxin oxidoreductase subunit beta